MEKQVQNFNKSDLAISLSRKFPSLNDEIIIEGIDLILQEIINTVALDNRVEIRGFGSFSKKTIRPRKFVNPKTKKVFAKFQANQVLADDEYSGPMTNAFGSTTSNNMGYGTSTDQQIDVNEIILDWMKQIKKFY